MVTADAHVLQQFRCFCLSTKNYNEQTSGSSTSKKQTNKQKKKTGVLYDRKKRGQTLMEVEVLQMLEIPVRWKGADLIHTPVSELTLKINSSQKYIHTLKKKKNRCFFYGFFHRSLF